MAHLPPLLLPLGPPGDGAGEGGAPPRKKAKTEKDPNLIKFKAHKATEYRQLSNLFGPVEFGFQAVKFREGSGVYEYLITLMNMPREHWTEATFDEEATRLKIGEKNESWTMRNASGSPIDFAVGLFAQGCSGLAYKQSDTFTARLQAIFKWYEQRFGTPCPAAADFQAGMANPAATKAAERRASGMKRWQERWVKGELPNAEKDVLLKNLLRDKFRREPYHSLLLSTGEKRLGEQDNRAGRVDRYTIGGGNVLGTLLEEVRAELRA